MWFSWVTNWNQAGSFLRDLLAVVGMLLLALSLMGISKEAHFTGFWAILPVLGSGLIIAAGTRPWFNSVVISNRVLVWFGVISFPLYLWHWPLLSFATIIEGQVPSRPIRMSRSPGLPTGLSNVPFVSMRGPWKRPWRCWR